MPRGRGKRESEREMVMRLVPQLGAREALLGRQLADKNPDEYKNWLIGRVGKSGSVKKMENAYSRKFGAHAAQGFFAFKITGVRDVEKYFNPSFQWTGYEVKGYPF
jgi:hypothetical protein